MASFESNRSQILLLFQEAQQQVAFSELLGEEYTVFAAGTPEGALTILARQKERIRIVLTDLKTLRKGGLDMLVKAAQTFRSLRVIVAGVSAAPDSATPGCIVYLPESPSLGLLSETISMALDEQKRPACALQDVLELFSLSHAKVALTLVQKHDAGEDRGKIYFEQGKITNALAGDLHGAEALRELLAWKHAAFFTRYNVVAKQKPLAAEWRDLLAMPAAPDIPRNAQSFEASQTVLRTLREESEGMECACVLDDSDRVLAVFPEQEPARLTALASGMASLKHLSEHAGQLIGIDAIEEISVIHDAKLYLLYPLPAIGMLGVLADPESQGMLRWNCREALLRLKELW